MRVRAIARAIAWASLTALLLTGHAQAAGVRTEVARVPGSILDVSPDRILFRDGSGCGQSNVALKIRDRATGETTDLPRWEPSWAPSYGFLTDRGAIFLACRDPLVDPFHHIFEWRDGALVDLGPGSDLVVAGHYAIWELASGGVLRRDLGAGTTTLVSSLAGNTFNDVRDDGAVVYWTQRPSSPTANDAYDIFRWRDGNAQRLTQDDDSIARNAWPLVGENTIVYRKQDPTSCCMGDSLAAYTSTGETPLEASVRNGNECAVRRWVDYRVAGDWVAYTRADGNCVHEAWLRSPDGAYRQVDYAGLEARDASILGVNPAGDVAVRVTVFDGEQFVSHLVLEQAGAAAQDYGPTGTFESRRGLPDFVFWQDGQWFEAAGGALFRLNVQDNTPPVLTVPADITVDATSPAGATVTYNVSASDDVDDSPNVSCTPSSGSTFPVGTTKVSCTATDAAGNTTSKSFNVVVRHLRPTSKDQCKHGGWKTYGIFKNQGDCVSFVATGGKNPPAGSP